MVLADLLCFFQRGTCLPVKPTHNTLHQEPSGWFCPHSTLKVTKYMYSTVPKCILKHLDFFI